ncbi:unnamed protein product, partial [marine sediment metagenome]
NKKLTSVLFILLIIISLILVFKLTKKCPTTEEICPDIPECPPCNLDCSDCPTIVTYRNITYTITKYICPDNNKIVDSIDDCEKPIPLSIPPRTSNEVGTVIENVTVKPTCVNGINGGLVFFKVGTIPSNIVFQLKEEGTYYKEKYSFSGLLTGYKYFTICGEEDGEGCKFTGDFYIEKNKIFLFRAMFNQTSRYGELQYSNEHIIDTTPDSEYLSKKCTSR